MWLRVASMAPRVCAPSRSITEAAPWRRASTSSNRAPIASSAAEAARSLTPVPKRSKCSSSASTILIRFRSIADTVSPVRASISRVCSSVRAESAVMDSSSLVWIVRETESAIVSVTRVSRSSSIRAMLSS